jgi:hypothetical protein
MVWNAKSDWPHSGQIDVLFDFRIFPPPRGFIDHDYFNIFVISGVLRMPIIAVFFTFKSTFTDYSNFKAK